MTVRSLVLFALCASAPLAAAAREVPAAPVEIVSVAANTGDAAGGHVALRVGAFVYHYQVYDDGLLQLTRERWPFFRIRYAELENRSLRALRLATAPEVDERLAAHLAALYAEQRWQLDRLEALGLETLWLERLGSEDAQLPLRALGLFAPDERDDPDALALRSAIEARHGADFLAEAGASVTEALRSHALEPSDPGAGVALGAGGAEIAAERLRDRLLLREALRVLAEARPLAEGAAVDPEDAGPASVGSLTAAERARLERLAGALGSSVVRLVRSRRPDRGFPLLLAAARYQAVRRSLAAGRLLVLDSFGDASASLGPDESRRVRPLLETLADDARASWRSMRARVVSEGEIDESGVHALEEVGSVAAELRAAAAGTHPLRMWGGELRLPDRRGAAALPAITVDAAERERALGAARTLEVAYRARMTERYGYELTRLNCATELARAIGSTFESTDEAASALGGTLEPGESLTFVPALLRREAGHRFRSAGEREIPSYRERRVAALAREGPALLVALRESNTLTSRTYRPSYGDDPFLWFSDGPLPLRPLQGVSNVGYGLVRAALGVATLPFDRGRRTLAGLRGAFYSLPELVGWNLRKGRYDRLPAADGAD